MWTIVGMQRHICFARGKCQVRVITAGSLLPPTAALQHGGMYLQVVFFPFCVRAPAMESFYRLLSVFLPKSCARLCLCPEMCLVFFLWSQFRTIVSARKIFQNLFGCVQQSLPSVLLPTSETKTVLILLWKCNSLNFDLTFYSDCL